MPIKDALKFLERMKDDKEFRKRIMNSYKKAVQKSIKDEGYKFTEVELREARMRMRQEEKLLRIRIDVPKKDALKFLERMKDDKEFRKRIMNSYKKAVQKSMEDEGYKFTEVELREARMRMRQEEINLGIILASQTGCHRCGCG